MFLCASSFWSAALEYKLKKNIPGCPCNLEGLKIAPNVANMEYAPMVTGNNCMATFVCMSPNRACTAPFIFDAATGMGKGFKFQFAKSMVDVTCNEAGEWSYIGNGGVPTSGISAISCKDDPPSCIIG
ncbi:unnamed protein product [Caenorhabditis auriculariae]|uniref:Uncharacterized protein n=1 Tax=Caenorhabditis auriculariae TaxID=2777116 RepID=A0A8S1HMG0_9PELO|nr:unnamed protein product [Caenorhabditis auriculariae]